MTVGIGAPCAGVRDQAAQMKQPNLAEMVAGHLRSRILAGEFRDGDLLPKQDALLAAFPVSRPSLREALRVLESEGLITVRRGKVGGAVVHRPTPAGVARTLSLVLSSRSVALSDVARALAEIEPLCAGMCAERPDRHEAVLPVLEEHNAQFERALKDGNLNNAVASSRRFHEEIVRLCGNETLLILVSAIETIWSDQYLNWAVETDDVGEWPDPQARQAAADDHVELLRVIREGDVEGATQLARTHLVAVSRFPMEGDAGDRAVELNQLGPGSRNTTKAW